MNSCIGRRAKYVQTYVQEAFIARYLSRQPAGWFRYHRHITPALRPLLGGRAAIVRYIAAMPLRDAEEKARAFAVDDDVMLKGLKALTPAEAAEMAAVGGLSAVRQIVPLAEAVFRSREESRAIRSTWDPRKISELMGGSRSPAEIALNLLDWQKPGDHEPLMREQVRRSRAMLGKIETSAASEFSLDALLALWERVRQPKVTRQHRATVARRR